MRTRTRVKTADVIIYDGHAGRRARLLGRRRSPTTPRARRSPRTSSRTSRRPTKQQVYLFNGCETYTGYADKLYENPKRNAENTDVITTGNFSAIQRKANQVIAFIHSFIDQKVGRLDPALVGQRARRG